MYAGLLNEKIEIYDFTMTKSIIGVVTSTINKVYETRAKVSHRGGSRTVINEEVVTPYQKTFVVRIYVPVTDTSWIKYNGKYYRVVSIDKDIAMQQQVILTDEVLDYVEPTSYSYTSPTSYSYTSNGE